ncbi:MAG: TrkA C-terminal domain-containing protein, partial [Smithellaceae bacterium]|nr:TrkA C-terminal domain-containing protein [Smithellaceae bacterium]
HLKAPESLVGKTLLESGIRERTGCTVIAISRDGKMSINPEAKTVIKEDDELVLIGTFDAEKSFLREIKT